MITNKFIRFFSGAFLLLYALMLNSVAESASPDRLLTGPNQGKPYNIALDYLNKHLHSLGITQADLNNMVVKDLYVTKHNGVTHIYLRQQYNDIEVFSGDISINIAADGSVINVNNHFVPNLAKAINRTTPLISAYESVGFVAQHFSQTITTDALMAQTQTFD